MYGLVILYSFYCISIPRFLPVFRGTFPTVIQRLLHTDRGLMIQITSRNTGYMIPNMAIRSWACLGIKILLKLY
jgi:hypothetical protein